MPMTTRLARYRVLRGLFASTLLLTLGMGAHAQVTPKAAPPEDQTLQEVVVTGSRIARPEFPTTSSRRRASILKRLTNEAIWMWVRL